MNKLLTISIAAYNIQETIDECLSCFLKCKHLNAIEILIISDGSTDNTAKIARRYCKKYPDSIRLIEKENGGWGSTLNEGFKYAHGKYFRQLDGDDYYDAGNLDLFVEYIKDCDTDLIISPFCHYEDSSGAITKFFENDKLYHSRESITIDETDTLFPPAMHSLCVKTKVLVNNDIQITEHCFYTDVEFVLKALNCSKTMSFFELPIYYYRLGRDGQSMSITGVKKHYKDHQRMLLGMYDYVLHNSRSEQKKKIMLKRLFEATMYQYKFYMCLDLNKKRIEELREFDSKLKEISMLAYNQNYGAPIRLFRSNGFKLVKPVAAFKNIQDRKNEVFLYEK